MPSAPFSCALVAGQPSPTESVCPAQPLPRPATVVMIPPGVTMRMELLPESAI
jgi:hypothetical protein